jgi:hypothetical protein
VVTSFDFALFAVNAFLRFSLFYSAPSVVEFILFLFAVFASFAVDFRVLSRQARASKRSR